MGKTIRVGKDTIYLDYEPSYFEIKCGGDCGVSNCKIVHNLDGGVSIQCIHCGKVEDLQ